MTERQVLSIAITILMTTVLLSGLIRRQKHGVANIGFESFGIVVLYAFLLAVRFWTEL